ncbi:MAG: hypothetical protein LBC62_04080 [Treponema sp.]|nr:hypothetical protein [Treponema sp.]
MIPEGYGLGEHISMHHQDLKAVNSARSGIVRPGEQHGGCLDGTMLNCRLAPASCELGNNCSSGYCIY